MGFPWKCFFIVSVPKDTPSNGVPNRAGGCRRECPDNKSLKLFDAYNLRNYDFAEITLVYFRGTDHPSQRSVI